MGESQIIKDNFVFGLSERKDVHQSKVDSEDGIRNRDAKKHADRRCDFWLIFDNGVRMTVEMAEACEVDTDLMPRSQLPAWLQKKINKENTQSKFNSVLKGEPSVVSAKDEEGKAEDAEQDEKPEEPAADANDESAA